MKYIKLFEEFANEKTITIDWNDDENSLVFSDVGLIKVDYDGEFKYRNKWFSTAEHEGPEDLIKDLTKAFKADKFVYVNESLSKSEIDQIEKYLDKYVDEDALFDLCNDFYAEDEEWQEVKNDLDKSDLMQWAISHIKSNNLKLKDIKSIFEQETNEAYSGNLSDFKYDLQMAVEEIGVSPVAIKKVTKIGKGYEVRMSSYMSSEKTWNLIGTMIGAELKSFQKGSINVGIFEKYDYPEGVKTTGDKILDKFAKLIHAPSATVKIMSWAVQGLSVPFMNGPQTFSVTGNPSEDTYAIRTSKGVFRLKKNEIKKAEELYDEVESLVQAGKSKRSIEESVVNEAKELSRDEMMKIMHTKYGLNFVKKSEEFDGEEGGIWLGGTDPLMPNAKDAMFNYYHGGSKYPQGVHKDLAKFLDKCGWYGQFADPGTVMLWPKN